MKPATFVLTLLAASLLSSPASPQDKVKDLQKQRIETLKQATEIGLKLYQSGRLEVGPVLEDRMALLKAEVEANLADRIPLYTQAVDSLKQYEALAKAQHEAGRGSEYAMLRVRAKRLEVEVLLEKAKAAKDAK
jgi:outer membrane protein TolC